jgi:hypothetical protein
MRSEKLGGGDWKGGGDGEGGGDRGLAGGALFVLSRKKKSEERITRIL